MTSDSFLSGCIGIDLEVSKKTNRVLEVGAIRISHGGLVEDPEKFHLVQTQIPSEIRKLDAFCRNAVTLVGHNIIAFDLPHLVAISPRLLLHDLPVLDTLWLNPLAFPKNPYHHLVKHYQDGELLSGQINNPVADSQLTLALLSEQHKALIKTSEQEPDLVLAWHWLVSSSSNSNGFERLFNSIRKSEKPSQDEAQEALKRLLAGKACSTFASEFILKAGGQSKEDSWGFAYALAWLSVSGGSSVMPPWVRHQFSRAAEIIRRLRDTSCRLPTCEWCASRHDPVKELCNWFPKYTKFRTTPTDASGKPLQQAIVEAVMNSEHVLGILPTGTGKSVCYQVPALSRFFKTGSLTVVISPLVALMADQVTGLINQGITSGAAISGLLSMPERKDVLDRIRLGDIGILLLSPEQLRNRTVRKAIQQREIGAWVFDEAHCVSKWGHDFRPDYRYVSRFIRENSVDGLIPPILCLTATAKPDVMDDMVQHFREKLGVELKVFNGGANRTNLSFQVIPTTQGAKLSDLHQILVYELPRDYPGGAIIYCSTRKKTIQIAEYLTQQNYEADYFHGKMRPDAKKDVQDRFINGSLRVIVATNAFGMGIDKPDVRLVIHADIPGSLENYLQEAGRAGRDSEDAKCILMFTPEDVERQFSMSARSRLSSRDIQTILKSIKRLDRKKRLHGEIVTTAGEILREDEYAEFNSSEDKGTDDTRVKTGVSWLEESELLQREENIVSVFPSSLQVKTIEEAKKRLEKAPQLVNKDALLSIVNTLISADPDEGISTDELSGVTGLSQELIRKAMHDLEQLQICKNDMALTAFVNVGVQDSSARRLDDYAAIEKVIVDTLRENAPDMTAGETYPLDERLLTQQIKDSYGGSCKVFPELVLRLLKGLADDGRRSGDVGTVRLSRRGQHFNLTLQEEWSALLEKIRLRILAANLVLTHFVDALGQGQRGVDLLAKTTTGDLEHALQSDLEIGSSVKEIDKLTQRALLWLHDQKIIQINKGLAVFRSAMTIHLNPKGGTFTKENFAPLKVHYAEQVFQIHVMSEYANLGQEEMTRAKRLVEDYFTLQEDEFVKKWMPNREAELSRQTSPQSWRKIVEDLANPNQKKIVSDERDSTNVLVLAGPGSGKTRVLVHRIGYLIRVRRENPRGILALAYNRHAAVEIRRRLRELIGSDANDVLVMTCHAMAMRLVGVSFVNTPRSRDKIDFDQVIRDAINLLKGDGLPQDEGDEQRERLLSGFRWILVDEYQDIGKDQYELIAALAGRTLEDEDSKLSLFAVGDDDQNIYAFNGANVDFIRQFETDYRAKPSYLVENYRSTRNIIEASNSVISYATKRMKVEYPIVIDKLRSKLSDGGLLEKLDPVSNGRVSLLRIERCNESNHLQALSVVDELVRISQLATNWQWERSAVIARNWEYLSPVRSYCESLGIPVQMGDEDFGSVWRLRETQRLVKHVREKSDELIDLSELMQWLKMSPTSHWNDLLIDGLSDYRLESGFKKSPANLLVDWIAEWGQELRRKQTGLLLVTAHSAKGLEFDHVAILDGDWVSRNNRDSQDEIRRLFYVAMTRAKVSLTIASVGKHHFEDELVSTKSVLERSYFSPTTLPIGVSRLFVLAQLNQVDIGYSGRYPPNHKTHECIRRLQAGSALQLLERGGKYRLIDSDGNEVGSMAQSFKVPFETTCTSAKVYALHTRWKSDVKPQFLSSTRANVWEVVIPELVFE